MRINTESTTIKLNETKNMMRVIAESVLKTHDEYLCLVDGQKIRVVK